MHYIGDSLKQPALALQDFLAVGFTLRLIAERISQSRALGKCKLKGLHKALVD